MLRDIFGWNFFFLQSAWISAFGLELNKETLLGYLFADLYINVHCLSRKEKKRKYCVLIGSVQITIISIFPIVSQSACVAHAWSVFPLGKIWTEKSRFESHAGLFIFCWTPFFHCYYFIFLTTNCKPASKRHLKEKKKKNLGRSKIVT